MGEPIKMGLLEPYVRRFEFKSVIRVDGKWLAKRGNWRRIYYFLQTGCSIT
jgi:hypothetical protein